MEDSDHSHSELDHPTTGRRSKKSPTFEFFAFLFIFGWPGPLGIYLGLSKGNLGATLAGLAITIFFWWFCRGFDLLKEYISHLNS